MSNTFSSSEIVQMGVNIEKNGKEFYTVASEDAKTPEIKKVFEFLASEEEKHVEVFEQILSKVGMAGPAEAYNEDYYAYLKVLSDEHVFTKENTGGSIANSADSEMDALDIAIGFEKDSILLYYEMKNLVPQNEKEAINELIAQEQEHYRRLTSIKESFKNLKSEGFNQ